MNSSLSGAPAVDPVVGRGNELPRGRAGNKAVSRQNYDAFQGLSQQTQRGTKEDLKQQQTSQDLFQTKLFFCVFLIFNTSSNGGHLVRAKQAGGYTRVVNCLCPVDEIESKLWLSERETECKRVNTTQRPSIEAMMSRASKTPLKSRYHLAGEILPARRRPVELSSLTAASS